MSCERGLAGAGPGGCRGLTLVEVLVVLFILALLAQTAVLATEGVIEQQQRDATVRSLEAFESAVLGAPVRVDTRGTPLIRGFVADMGRLPLRGAADDASRFLEELWAMPGGDSFAFRSPPGDSYVLYTLASGAAVREVEIGCGWRGPYLLLGARLTGAPQRFTDGWGRDFACESVDGTTLDPGDPIGVVHSLGADNVVGGTGYDEDLRAFTEHSIAPIVPARWKGSVPVSIDSPTAGARYVVRIYGPRMTPVGVEVRTLAQAPPAGQQGLPSGTAAITLHDVPIGPRVLRVYELPVGDLVPAADDPAGSDAEPWTRSPAIPIVVEARSTPTAIVVKMP